VVNRFNWVEIRVRDLERAKNFYAGIFDWKTSGKKIGIGRIGL
jgi:predicted enzyme related to lactoylglutathione lyase